MIYREKRIKSGKILEIEIYPISKAEKAKSRKRKEKESVKCQRNLNDKNAKKKLRRLINTNFDDDDLAIHLTYTEKNLPKSETQARKDIANYIRRIKGFRKKQGLPELKYIAVIEYREQEEGSKKKVRLHHHIIMSGMDRDQAEKIWKQGRANADRLQADECGYEALANYISKDPNGSKRWTQSKNLKQPEVRVNDSRWSRGKIERLNPGDKDRLESLYKGYLLTECRVEANEVTAALHVNIKMRSG